MNCSRIPSIEIVVNLTIPAAHVEVGPEGPGRPASTSTRKSRSASTTARPRLSSRRRQRGLRVGCAPDTFLGGSHQTCRKLVDEGAIGRPLPAAPSSCAPAMSAGIPNPAFYYAKGGGPMLDMGPYYITALVNLLGPVARVSGIATRARSRARRSPASR